MTRDFTTEDLFLHRKVVSLHGVAALDRVVCEVRAVNEARDGYITNVWEFATDGSGGRQVTFGDSDVGPRLSPQGDRIAFTSQRSGGTQLFVLPRAGGEASQVGKFDSGVGSLRWMPDGSGFIVSATVPEDLPRSGPWSRLERPDPQGVEVEVNWRLPYKEDAIGNILRRHVHLFHVDATSGEKRQLTQGGFDVLGFDVAPDGASVAYTRSRDGRFAHSYDLWVLDLRTGEQRQVTSDHAMVMQPVWSPDGSRIAFTGAQEEGDAEPRLWIATPGRREVAEVCAGRIDVADPETVQWGGDGRSIRFMRAFRGRHQIARVDLDRDEVVVLSDHDRQLGALSLAAGRFVYAVEHPSLPSEAWSCDANGQGETQLSALNEWWKDRTPIEVANREFKVPDGKGSFETIQGWLLRRHDAPAPAPLLNDMHGGPASYALLDFDTNVFWQVLCSRGWAVLALNAVGSSSFGREFCRRLSGHWGELDLPQHLAAIDALQAEGVCDDRLAVSGKSYGGFLSCWTIGHTPRFKAAVVMAPVGNIETHYGTSDGGYYADPYYIATKPEFDRNRARELSPLQYVEQAITPTLFMQGKDDERCPKCQSEELFVSLYRAGDTPAQLVLYPGETHGFLGEGAPGVRRDAADRIVAWLEHYADGAADKH